MAVRHILVERSPEAVWSTLSDPRAYASWVVGTAHTQPGTGTWPEPGTTLEYSAGVGPLTFDNRTIVRICEPPRRLELEAFGGLLGTARIAIEIIPWGNHALVVVDEHPLRGAGGWLHSLPLDFVLQLRHRRMLSRLAAVVEKAAAQQEDRGTAAPLADLPGGGRPHA
jgi:carbon monoxide dehydrogenase subunit G